MSRMTQIAMKNIWKLMKKAIISGLINLFIIFLGVFIILVTVSLVFAQDYMQVGNEVTADNATYYIVNMYYASCTESWSCIDWSSCTLGSQTRTCTDANNCGTVISRPTLNQSCIGDTGGGIGTPSNVTETIEDGDKAIRGDIKELAKGLLFGFVFVVVSVMLLLFIFNKRRKKEPNLLRL